MRQTIRNMRGWALGPLAMAVAVGGCATMADGGDPGTAGGTGAAASNGPASNGPASNGPASNGLDSITYTLGPCYGTCPAFTVTAHADGVAEYDGESHVAQTGPRQVRVSPAAWRAFAERLAPFRPEEDTAYDMTNCSGPVATDAPTTTVTWHDADGTDTTLKWYMGCGEPDLVRRREQIHEAWRELPIVPLVGKS